MKIRNRNDSRIEYGKVNGYLVRIDCPPEKPLGRREQVVTVFVIVAGIYGLCLFF